MRCCCCSGIGGLGRPPYTLILRDDGNLLVQGTAYNGAGYVTLWQTNTGSQQPTPVPGTPSYLTSGNSLAVNQYLLSPQVCA
jgi:hypothetical protein